MADLFTKEVQKRLKALGLYSGPLDGIAGAGTRGGLEALQRKAQIVPSGIADEATVAVLFAKQEDEKRAPAKPGAATPPWIDLVLAKRGLHESRNKAELMKFLRSDGKTLGDPTKLPWCGEIPQTAFALTIPNELQPSNPYLARNWARFGVACKPQLGAVGAFWRGSKTGTSGHVGFLVAERSDAYYVLGGNQSNAITVAPVAKNRLLAARWPKTVAQMNLPLGKMVGGVLSLNEA